VAYENYSNVCLWGHNRGFVTLLWSIDILMQKLSCWRVNHWLQIQRTSTSWPTSLGAGNRSTWGPFLRGHSTLRTISACIVRLVFIKWVVKCWFTRSSASLYEWSYSWSNVLLGLQHSIGSHMHICIVQFSVWRQQYLTGVPPCLYTWRDNSHSVVGVPKRISGLVPSYAHSSSRGCPVSVLERQYGGM
jgi:hypothetical protein